MTLERAIEILSKVAKHQRVFDADRIEAITLGVEALKAYKRARQERQLSPDKLLEGETKG